MECVESTTIKERLLKGQPAMARTRGVSMRPLLIEGKSYVILKSLVQADGSRRELLVHELPIYLRPDGVYVIHRLIKKDADYYYTRGDNCLKAEKIPRDWVLGVVEEINRKGKKISVTDSGYRFYVKVWTAIYPSRAFLKRVRMFLGRIRRHGKK